MWVNATWMNKNATNLFQESWISSFFITFIDLLLLHWQIYGTFIHVVETTERFPFGENHNLSLSTDKITTAGKNVFQSVGFIGFQPRFTLSNMPWIHSLHPPLWVSAGFFPLVIKKWKCTKSLEISQGDRACVRRVPWRVGERFGEVMNICDDCWRNKPWFVPDQSRLRAAHSNMFCMLHTVCVKDRVCVWLSV